MVIKNYNQLATNKLRKDALNIIESAYEAIDIESLTKKRVKIKKGYLCVSDASRNERVNLKKFKRIFLIGFGKGSSLAIATLAGIFKPLGSRFVGGISLDVKNSNPNPSPLNPKIKFFKGTHPKPSITNVRTTQKIVDLVRSAGQNDLVIYFIGGGGSSLLCGSLGELNSSKFVFDQLTQKGASIKELNIVRKHLSEVKGGGLTKFTYPATSVSLIVSDVCGNDFSTIASGPTVFDKTKIEDAIGIFRKYNISFKGVNFIETPKDKKYFTKSKYFLLACNQDAALAMLATARKIKYTASILSLAVEKEVSQVFIESLKKIKNGEAIIMAGETTVKIKGKGKGGRNQEACLFVLSRALSKMINIKDILVSSFASDGFDNTPVAGAIVDQESLEKTKNLSLNPKKFLSKNDSFSFFRKTQDQIYIQRKSFNVSDLMLIIKK
ncbi:MAG: DUF4147 domain-containing protein [Candidatus Paceibacterota bacterium]|jgi:glycerate-2-kinase